MRSDFPILKNLTYLDSAATTQKPQQVIDAITHFYEHTNANVHRGIYTLSQKATLAYEDARERVAEFINANTIAFTSGTTQSLNMVSRMLNLKEGDEVLLTEMEHHSNLVPWQKTKATITYIPIKDFKLDLEAAKKLITKNTKVVSLTHVSNTLGTINPIKELIALAKEVNAITVIDAAQSVAHMKVDVKDLDCDFLAFSGHKICGPTGIGVLYIKDPQHYASVNFGGGMVVEVTKEHTIFQDFPEGFEAGTPNIAGAVGLAAAIDYLKDKTHEDLTRYAYEQLSNIKGLTIIGPKDERAPVFSFTLEGIHPHDVAEILDKYNIAVRAGHHCTMPLMKILNLIATTRASFYLYNTKEDVDALVRGIKKVQEVFA